MVQSKRKQFYRQYLSPLTVWELEEIYQIWVERTSRWAIETSSISGKDFYASKPWLTLRYNFLSKSNRKCVVCGRGPKQGAVLHVDHILPRWLYQELALDATNLRITCEECNLGKGMRVYQTPEKILVRRATKERSVRTIFRERWDEEARRITRKNSYAKSDSERGVSYV